MGEIRQGARAVVTAALFERAKCAATGFRELGVSREDTVAICLRNDLAMFEASIGAGMIGAYSVPVNWHCTEDEARYLLVDANPRAIVIHADLLEHIRKAIPKGVPIIVVPVAGDIRAAYGIDDRYSSAPEGLIDWNKWVDSHRPIADDIANPPGSIIYTSGTTGRPKGVRRAPPTPEQAQASTRIVLRTMGFTPYMDNPERIITVITGPLYHSAPNMCGLLAARVGASLILQPRFDAAELLKLIERHRVTHLHMVPIMFNRILKLPDEVRKAFDISSLKYVVHAAAPVAQVVKKAMIDWWGNIINEYYGCTETSGVVFCTATEWLAHPGTVGRPMPEAEVRVIDQTGNNCAAGVPGEIVARNHSIADFTYHGDREMRRDAEKQGLILTGDIGYFDDDGFLYLCDRAKDMVISGGVNIYPAEIESELQRMPGIEDCAVFGIPDDEYGESLCASVQLQAGHKVSENDVKTYLRGRVAGFKIPKRVEFHEALPREDSGKIFKRKLREPFWEGLKRRI